MRKHTTQSTEKVTQSKKKRNRFIDLLLTFMIIGCLSTAAYLFINPIIIKHRQDAITNDLNQQIDSGLLTPIRVNSKANPVGGESYDFYGNDTNFDDLPDEVDLIPLGRIEIPSIHVNLPVLEGATTVQLRYGLAHVPDSAKPGSDQGNSAILGHRMLDNGRHLNRLNEVKVGDEIWFKTPTEHVKYVVIDMPIIDPDQLPDYIDKNYGEPTITLITCHPIPSWTHRLLCVAKRVETIPHTPKK